MNLSKHLIFKNSIFKITTLVCILFINVSKGQVEGIKNLEFMIGTWKNNTTQILSNGTNITEKGNAKIKYALNKTYLQVEVELCRSEERCRKYIQYITYYRGENQFESVYLYNATAIKITEKGKWDNQKNELVIQGINPWSAEKENNINIISTFKYINKKHFKLEVNELRNGKWEIGYKSSFTK